MEFRQLEITDMKAKDLKKVNLMSKMDVYAIVSISGDPFAKQRTAVDKDGGTSPKWKNLGLKFNLDAAAADQNRLTLDFLIRSDRVLGDRDIGVVHVPVKELLENPGDEKVKVASYQVHTPSGKAHGNINFSYTIGEKFAAAAPPAPPARAPIAAEKSGGEPVMAYPPNPAYPPPAGAYPPQYAPPGGYAPPPPGGYAPPPQGAYPPPGPGYGYPPPPGPMYGHAPPPGPGYGYPPQQQAAPAKNKSKFGLGAGLGAGLLGGLLVGEMASDIGDMDGGFDF